MKRFKPQLVAVRNESLISELKEALFDCEHKPEIIPGEEGVVEVARHPDVVTVVTGIVGYAGLKVTPATYWFFPQAGVKAMGMEYVVVSSTEKEKETRCGNNEGRAAASIEKENGRKENGTHIEEEATHGMLLLLSY